MWGCSSGCIHPPSLKISLKPTATVHLAKMCSCSQLQTVQAGCFGRCQGVGGLCWPITSLPLFQRTALPTGDLVASDVIGSCIQCSRGSATMFYPSRRQYRRAMMGGLRLFPLTLGSSPSVLATLPFRHPNAWRGLVSKARCTGLHRTTCPDLFLFVFAVPACCQVFTSRDGKP